MNNKDGGRGHPGHEAGTAGEGAVGGGVQGSTHAGQPGMRAHVVQAGEADSETVAEPGAPGRVEADQPGTE